MLHNITLPQDEFLALEKKPYYVAALPRVPSEKKPKLDNPLATPTEFACPFEEGDGIVFTLEGTREQKQFAISCVDPVFKSKVILGLWKGSEDDLKDVLNRPQ